MVAGAPLNRAGGPHATFLPSMYHSSLGRWTTTDPVMGDPSNPQTLNRYAYVSNNPLNKLDPEGLFISNEVSQDDGGGGWGFSGFGSGVFGGQRLGGGGGGGGAGGGGDGHQPSKPQPKPKPKPANTKPKSPARQHCENAAIAKFNDTVDETIFNNTFLPFKSLAKGTTSGAIVGCVLTVEAGCVEGAVPGALTGAFGGVLEGAGEAVHHDITAYRQAKAQLKKDLASCPPQ